MTELEAAMAAGGKPVESDFERALKAGGKEPEGPSVLDRVKRGVGIAATGVSNALDTATGGAYRFVRDQLPAAARNIASGDAHRILFGNPEEKPSEAAQYEQQVNEAHPLYANVTSDLGYLVPGGAPVRAAEAATAGVEALAARVPKVISRVLRARPVAGAAVSGVVTGGSQVAQDVASGAPLDADLAKRAGRATAIGAALGGGAGTIGAAGSATARAIRNPKNLIGRTIRDVEAAGGRISATGNPTRGGIYETPEMQALPEGREGNNQLAYQEGQRITAHNEAKLANARSEYGKELSDRLSANGDSNHFVVDTHQLLDRLADENTVNGVVGDQHLANAIEKTRQMLTKEIRPGASAVAPEPEVRTEQEWRQIVREWDGHHGHTTMGDATNPGARGSQGAVARARTELPPSSNAGAAPLEDWPAVNVPDLIKTKRIVDGMAEHGMPSTPENRPYRMIASSLARELEGVDPQIAALNKRYAGTMSDLERANDVIYGSDRAEIPTRAAKERRAAGFMGRIGDDTQAGTIAAPQLDELAGLDPAYAASIRRMRAKKAQERLRYGYPEVSTNIEKAGHSFVRQNLDAAKARVALPVAEALGRIGPSPLSVMYLPEAVRAAREARRKMENRR